jgi:hypothetical protein
MPNWFLGLNRIARAALVLAAVLLATGAGTPLFLASGYSRVFMLCMGALILLAGVIVIDYEILWRDSLPEGKRDRYWNPKLIREGRELYIDRVQSSRASMAPRDLAWFDFKFDVSAFPLLWASGAALALFALTAFDIVPWHWILIGFVAVWTVVASWLLLSYLLSDAEDAEAAAAPPPSFRERLRERLRRIIVEGEGKYPLPPDEVFEVVLAAGEKIYYEPRYAPPILAQQRPPLEGDEQRAWDAAFARWKDDSAVLYEAIVQSLSAYLSHLPRFHSAPFTAQFAYTGIGGETLNGIIRPFTFNDELKARGLSKGLRDAYYANVREYTASARKKTDTVDLYPSTTGGSPTR